jgi:hypothetical protein
LQRFKPLLEKVKLDSCLKCWNIVPYVLDCTLLVVAIVDRSV